MLNKVLFKLIYWYIKLSNYIRISAGFVIIDPDDITIKTSLIHKGSIAPKGKVFYICEYRARGIHFHKNVGIKRNNLTEIEELLLKRKCRRYFAATVERMLSK